MPSILNLKFKGNKSFVPFSNLGDVDSLTKTWKVCTKVASFLEQGQRLENLSWRLWHLQNLMVETDNARSKREFRRLSKCMSDKLDKEKGRSIEELQAPGFRRNHSTDIIQQRAIEKEKEREANHGRTGTINRMQFTFSVDQPSAPCVSTPCQKPDLKPSAEFKDNKRARPSTRASHNEPAPTTNDTQHNDPPLTQRGRKQSTAAASITSTNVESSAPAVPDAHVSASLRFPSLFSNDFGPSALLYPSPTLTNVMTYGEGLNTNANTADGFSIVRPTIEVALDDILNADSPGGWSSSAFNSVDTRQGEYIHHEDVDMKPASHENNYGRNGEDESMLASGAPLRNVHHLSHIEDVVPRTITPSRLGPNPVPSATHVNGKRPSLSVRTQGAASRTSGPGATPVGGQQNSNANSAPGGVKAECSNCGATHTPLWRRGLNDELNCNACGLYCKLHKRPRPKSMRNNHGEGRAQTAPRQESQEVVAQCYNCHTTATPLWRKDDEGKTVCNACGLYYKLHGSARPISMKSDVIRKRARHDARRASGNTSETPSASPGASRRASPEGGAPMQTSDSAIQGGMDDGRYGGPTQTDLSNAFANISQAQQQNGQTNDGTDYSAQLTYPLPFPGPYSHDYIQQLYSAPADTMSYSNESLEFDGSESRSAKRRRLSNDSDPPSSATSYSSYTDSYSSASPASQPQQQQQQRSLEYPSFSYSSFGLFRSNNSMWHPPMLPPDNSPQFIHPPMVPPEESPMDYLQNMQHDDSDALFNAYLHPPMLPPEDSPKVAVGALLHPPMLPQEWGNTYEVHDTAMQAY